MNLLFPLLLLLLSGCSFSEALQTVENTFSSNPAPEGNVLLGPSQNEDQRIEKLIETVKNSTDMTFIRNGSRYSSLESAEHLSTKYHYEKMRIKTLDDFIVNIASKSSTTGQRYQVQIGDGKYVDAEEWLREKVRENNI